MKTLGAWLLWLWMAVVLWAAFFYAPLAAGFIVNNPTPGRIRLAPPLVLTRADAAAFLAAWPAILDEAMGSRS